VPALAAQLDLEGGRLYAQEHANELTDQALAALQEATPQGQAGKALEGLAKKLLQRDA
jgi:geranylgeranyl pyrophosphate synthase